MPGHVKLGKPGEADPDPAPYLIVSLEMKREDQLKPYDPRKSYWAPDGNGGYKEATLVDGDIEKEGAKCTVMIGHEVSNILLFKRYLNKISNKLSIYFQHIDRKKCSKLKNLARSTLPSLRSARTWLT